MPIPSHLEVRIENMRDGAVVVSVQNKEHDVPGGSVGVYRWTAREVDEEWVRAKILREAVAVAAILDLELVDKRGGGGI
jgi:hypothetical protein